MALANRPSSLVDQTSSSPSIDSSSTPWKRASGNSSKRLIAIQRSDRKLWPFRTVHPAWLDQTSSSPSIDSLPTPWKRASGNSSKCFIAIQRSDRKLWPLRTIHPVSLRSNGRIESYGPCEQSIQPGSTRPHHHRVSILHPLHGKGHPVTRVKV